MTEGKTKYVAEEYVPEAPTCWEEAAYDAVAEILRQARNHTGVVTDDALARWVAHDVDCIRDIMRDPDGGKEDAVRTFFCSVGVGAVANASPHEDLRKQFAWDVHALACSKQHDYGHDNINTEGITGLRVRLSDKIARFKNLLGRPDGAKNESLEDTKVDFLGYAIVAMMFIDGTFQLPLRADLAKELDPLKQLLDKKIAEYDNSALVAAEWEFNAILEDEGLDEVIPAAHDSRDVRDVWSYRDIEEVVHDVVNGMFSPFENGTFIPSFTNEDLQTIHEIAQEEVRYAIDVHEEYHHPRPRTWPLVSINEGTTA